MTFFPVNLDFPVSSLLPTTDTPTSPDPFPFLPHHGLPALIKPGAGALRRGPIGDCGSLGRTRSPPENFTSVMPWGFVCTAEGAMQPRKRKRKGPFPGPLREPSRAPPRLALKFRGCTWARAVGPHPREQARVFHSSTQSACGILNCSFLKHGKPWSGGNLGSKVFS